MRLPSANLNNRPKGRQQQPGSLVFRD